MERIVFTKDTATFLLKEALKERETIEVSLDLGKTRTKVLVRDGFLEAHGHKVRLEELERLKDNTVYTVEDGKVRVVELFSKDTNLYYKLRPTRDWPTIMLSSVPMHRFVTTTPKKDTETKIETIKPVRGTVLDTCCGLGYTAILASESGATKVDCFEKDTNVLTVAGYNPYSSELFNNPKITIHKESVFDGIKKIPDASIDCIVHDPPTPTFAKELYSKEFYQQLRRVLKKGIKLYHYAPNPGKTKGAEFWRIILKRLEFVGFQKVHYLPKSSGIAAEKH